MKTIKSRGISDNGFQRLARTLRESTKEEDPYLTHNEDDDNDSEGESSKEAGKVAQGYTTKPKAPSDMDKGTEWTDEGNMLVDNPNPTHSDSVYPEELIELLQSLAIKLDSIGGREEMMNVNQNDQAREYFATFKAMLQNIHDNF